MHDYERVLGWFFALFFVGVLFSFLYFVGVGEKSLTPLEDILFQMFVLVTGVASSFLFGRQSAKEAAREIIRPHARSASRRVLSLYESISQVGYAIESSRDLRSLQDYQLLVARIQGIVSGQLTITDDALKDWEDIVPDDVAELRQKTSSL